jgi:hypothetical protein
MKPGLFSLFLISTALIVAGCAPKTTRTPAPQPSAAAPDAGDKAKTDGSKTDSTKPDTTKPDTTKPDTRSDTTPDHTPSGPQTGGSTTAAPAAPATTAGAPAQTARIPDPQTLLAKIGDPVPPPPEKETQPSLIPLLWIRLHGTGNKYTTPTSNDFKPEISIVASPPLKDDRIANDVEDGRGLFYRFPIMDQYGHTTYGRFEFRHPENGMIESYHTKADGTQAHSIETLVEATKQKHHPFEIQIRVPIDEVTGDILFNAAQSFIDLQAKEAKDKGMDPLSALKDSLGAKIINTINKDRLNTAIITPAFDGWKKVMIDSDCHENIDPAKSKPTPNCHGEMWARGKVNDDLRAFMSYMDEDGQAARLIGEYLDAKNAADDYADKLKTQPAPQATPTAPMAPPSPPKNKTKLNIETGDLKILNTDGKPSGALGQPNRFKVVIVGDAFTNSAADITKFYTEAQKKWDYIFGSSDPLNPQPGVEPYRTYRNYFMGIAISTVSKVGHACHPERQNDSTGCNPGDTALGTSFVALGDDKDPPRLVQISPEGYQNMSALLQALVPDYDLGSVILNDTSYGGGGGTYAVASLDPEANEVFAHEMFGHSFAHLGDEYEDPYPGFPDKEEPNTSMKPTNDKWDLHLLDNKSTLVQPPADSQLFTQTAEGAHYHGLKSKDWAVDKWYRAFPNCKMRVLGKNSPFCPICRHQIIRTIYSKIKLVDSSSADSIQAKAGTPWKVQVQTVQPVNTQQLIQMQWGIGQKDCSNPTPISGATSSTLSSDALTTPLDKGKYKLCLSVWDSNIDVPVSKTAVSSSAKDAAAANPQMQMRMWDLKIN